MLSFSRNFCFMIILWILDTTPTFSIGESISKSIQQHNNNMRRLEDCPTLNQCTYNSQTDETVDWRCDNRFRLKEITWEGPNDCSSTNTKIDIDRSDDGHTCCIEWEQNYCAPGIIETLDNCEKDTNGNSYRYSCQGEWLIFATYNTPDCTWSRSHPYASSIRYKPGCCKINPTTTPRPTQKPTPNYFSVESDSIYGEIVETMFSVVDFFESVTCINEDIMWQTIGNYMSLYPSFLDNIMETTQMESLYSDLINYMYTYPIYYDDQDDCEVDYVLKENFGSFFEYDTSSSTATATDAQDYLSPIYDSIKEDIDLFGAILPTSHKKTSIAVTYSLQFCLDISIDFCYSYGFGFAFDFNNNVEYYKTGSQALSISLWDDPLNPIPGSFEIGVSYDILGDISYAPGNSYSIDVSISSGFLNTLVNELQDYARFIEDNYSFSYVAGVDSLNFADLDSLKCIGLSLSKSLASISGSVIPSMAYGISRSATKTIDELSPPETPSNSESQPTTWCISEQLFSVDCVLGYCGNFRPEIPDL